jgi:hypothetical protein
VNRPPPGVGCCFDLRADHCAHQSDYPGSCGETWTHPSRRTWSAPVWSHYSRTGSMWTWTSCGCCYRPTRKLMRLRPTRRPCTPVRRHHLNHISYKLRGPV